MKIKEAWDILFGKSDPTLEGPKPQIGELWIKQSFDGDPWGKEGVLPVTIVDIRDGWIRFKQPHGGSTSPEDIRMLVEEFTMFY